MSKPSLRAAIAAEAARLMLRNKEGDFAAARKRAARWLSKRKVAAEDMPTNAEIQSHMYELAGLFSQERQQSALVEIRLAALDLMQALQEFQPRLFGCAVTGPVLAGAAIQMCVAAESAEQVAARLEAAGFRSRIARSDAAGDASERVASAGVLRLHHRFLCEIRVVPAATAGTGVVPGWASALETEFSGGLDLAELQSMLREIPAGNLAAAATRGPAGRAGGDLASPAQQAEGLPAAPAPAPDPEELHADAFAAFHLLLARLEGIALDPQRHPEGDALYHSLQVFELGKVELPYDEEFLLACLLHDVGLGLDRRRHTSAGVEALRGLVTERTLFLIEHRPAALEYLSTGRISRALRRSEHFEDLLLLARCDRDGRVPGAPVCELEEALDYIAGLATAWDE